MVSENREELICVITTSTTCPKCKLVKENDIEFLDGRKFDKDFYLSLLSGGRVKVIELVYENSEIFIENIKEIYHYSLNPFKHDDIIVRKTKPSESTGCCIRETYDFVPGWEEIVVNSTQTMRINFSTFISKSVPKRLYNFVHIFPGFIIASIHDWLSAIREDHFFHAHSVGCVHQKIFEDKNIWIVNNNISAKDQTYLVDPLPILDKYLKTPELIHVIPDDLPSKSEDSEEVSKNYISIDTVRGAIRGNDQEVPFSNGLEYRYVPKDFSTVYYSKK